MAEEVVSEEVVEEEVAEPEEAKASSAPALPEPAPGKSWFKVTVGDTSGNVQAFREKDAWSEFCDRASKTTTPSRKLSNAKVEKL